MKALLFDFSEKHPSVQLLFLIFLMVVGALFSVLFSYAVGAIIWGPDILTSTSVVEGTMPTEQIAFMKFTQICNQLGMLLLPALFFARCQGMKALNYLKMAKAGGVFAFVIAIFVMFSISPFVAMLQEWNESMQFPECLGRIEAMMKMMEEQADKLTKIFIQANSIGGLLLNLCIMALLPAFAEELFFRGAVQNILKKWMKNAAWAVVVTAVIFSGFHFQFYGFFPRFVLGVVLGTLYVISGSLWVPIAAHFINNATAVIVGYLEYNGMTSISIDEFGQTEPDLVVVSVVVVLALFWVLNKHKKRNHLMNGNPD